MATSSSMPPETTTMTTAHRALPLQQLKQACKDIRALLRSLHDQRVRAREHNKPLDKTQFKADRWQVLVLLRALKAGLRDTFVDADAWKARVQEQKNVVEAHQLKLQNLLYEKDHLLREIRRCRGFSTKEMDKIEFEQGKLPFGVDPETHRQHLDQLTQELETRKRMIAQLKELKERIEQIDAATQTKQVFLDGLRNEVSSIEDATKALQLYMGEPVTAQLRRQHDASALPTPLYALFCELDAYVTASDSSQTMALAVVDAVPLTSGAKTSGSHLKRSFPSALQTGASASDQDKAAAEASTKRIRGPSRSPSVATIQPVADSARVPPSRSPSVLRAPATASPSPALETGEVVVTSTAEKLLVLRPYDESASSSASREPLNSDTHPSRSPTAQPNDQDMDVDDGGSDDVASRSSDHHDLWAPSPKALVLTLSLGIDGERIDGTAAAATFALRFQYLPVAKIVTVELVKPAKASSGAAPVPLPSVLMNLFPGDDGLSVPRLATNYAFMDAHGAETAFPHDAACRPYYWAQWICGLRAAKRPADATADSDAANAPPHCLAPSVRSVMTQLIKRLVAGVHLTKQLDVLATAAPSAPSVVFVHSAVRAQFPSSSSSSTTRIESWRAIPAPTRDIFALFHDHASRSQRPDATHGCRYFRVTFKHERAKLAAIVEVAPEYPVRAPRFLFQPKTVGASGKSESGHVATYENQLKEIEVEVNAFYNELVTSESEAFVLMHQLRKVELCFDVLNSALADGTAATLCFGRARRGKDRRQAVVMDSASKELRHR